ncbi:MAG: replicative DNA helicase [Betaproteobacteria bacterium]|nr:replicative DNA helicase [Betaproteobacteria bacterium]
MRNRRRSAEPNKRLLPHSVEAEQSVIGSLLRDNEAWIKVGDLISEQDFFRDDHRCIFRHIMGLLEKEGAADIVTVSDSIQKSDEVNQTGGLAYLKKIANATPPAANVRQYAEIVCDNAILRLLISACNDAAGSAFNRSGRDVQQILDEAQSRIFEVAEAGARSRKKIQTLSSALGQSVERIHERCDRNRPDAVTGLATGYIDFDDITSGLQRGDMIVIAGRPGMGSSTLAMNIAEHVGVDLGLPVLIFSLEMSAPQLALRFLSSRARVDFAKLRSARLTSEDWDKLTAGLERLHSAKISIDANGIINASELRAHARRTQREFKGLGLIVIDNIQMIASPQNAENRPGEVVSTSCLLKDLADELDVPVVAVSQLPRRIDERADKRPLLSDLRECGTIAQDADLVMFLYRDDYYSIEASKERGVTEVIIGKHLNGSIGEFRLAFNREFCRFESLARPRSA